MALILFRNSDINATVASLSQTFPSAGRNGWSGEATLTGSAFTGTWKVEVSNSGANWDDITAALVPPISQPTAVTGQTVTFFGVPPTMPPFDLVRITLTRTAGTATLVNVWVSEVVR